MVAFSRFARYFDELADKGSIRRAAERLNIVPSALDRQLILAEQELGLPLFERLPQGLRLTAAGELLVHGLRNWLRDYRRLLSQIDDLRGLRRGSVNLAVVEGVIQDLVPDLLAAFYRKYPGITCHVRVVAGEAVEQLVLNGEADVGLSFNPQESRGLHVAHSVTYRMGALLPPGHALLKLAKLRLSDLAQTPVIIADESTSVRRVLDQALRKTGVTLQPVVVVSQVSLIRSLVLRGVGVGLLTEIGALPEIADGSIVFRGLAEASISPSVMCALTATGRHLPVPAALLTEELVTMMELSKGKAAKSA
ncbi:MAG TPA: LysR family transcriptional regulator [Magnetospirillaceae bacterium]|jgi:DNA-binding transcriptional LysR family regulator